MLTFLAIGVAAIAVFSFISNQNWDIFSAVTSAILNAIGSIFYSLWLAGAAIINLVEDVFRAFAGLRPIGTGEGTAVQGDISTIIINHPQITCWRGCPRPCLV